tara:strand:+ start:36 stop:293 length:258 start_codon:yes stop_codon:yes gene_type:complete
MIDRRLKLYGFLLLTLMLGIMLGVNIMFFFGDIVHYLMPMDKGVGFYVMAGASNMSLVFALGISMYVSYVHLQHPNTVVGRERTF